MPVTATIERAPWLLAGAVFFLAVAIGARRNAGHERRPAERGPAEHRALESGRGRHASAPSEIPPRGWKDILVRVYRSISEDRVLAIAAGVTFYALLAIFPAIAALVSVYGLFTDPAGIGRDLEAVSGLLPGGAMDVIREQMTRVASQADRTLGVSLIVGLALSLWSANAGTKATFDALNVVYDEMEKRGFFRLTAVSLAFTIGAVLFLLVALAAVVALPVALQYLPLRNVTEWLVGILRWPALLLVVIVALAILYRYGPSRDRARWRWITWGSAFAGLSWVGASALFSWYAANFGSYNETYGSLGAVIGFMTWIWVSMIVVLLGAEINAEIEHQTVRDTTRGPAQPLGTRGATMADTVGAAQS